MSKLNQVILLLCFFFSFLFCSVIFGQSEKEIKSFFSDYSGLILSLAHNNSTLINSNIDIDESDDSEYEYKVILIISYKGFFKNHSLKCYIYFEDYPRKFIWGTDTNSFDFNNGPEVVFEELKDKWSKYDY